MKIKNALLFITPYTKHLLVNQAPDKIQFYAYEEKGDMISEKGPSDIGVWHMKTK